MKNNLQLLPLIPNTLLKSRFQYACLIAFVFSFSVPIHAQDQSSGKADYSKEPVWIKMMDDQHVNYYDAMKAYETYWKHHQKPAGEEEEMSEGKNDFKERERELKKEIKKDQTKKLSADDLKKSNENQEMKYQMKRFEQWAREVKPFVQEDGRILTDSEKMEIWKKQQEEIKLHQK